MVVQAYPELYLINLESASLHSLVLCQIKAYWPNFYIHGQVVRLVKLFLTNRCSKSFPDILGQPY